jgi:hypothetical protein
MLLLFIGITQKNHFSPSLGDHIILEGVCFFLSTVISLAFFLVLRAIDWALGAINDEF